MRISEVDARTLLKSKYISVAKNSVHTFDDCLAMHTEVASKDVRPSETKYGNKTIVIDGHKFHSKKEGARYSQLKMLEAAGKISDLRMQVAYILCPSVMLDGKKQRPINYIADFVYVAELDFIDGRETVEDVKGFKTPEYKLKRKFMKHVHNIEILET